MQKILINWSLKVKGAGNIAENGRETTHCSRPANKNEQRRFDCAGASGSRVKPFRKTNKSEERTTCASKHTFDAEFLRKMAWRISPTHHKISPLVHRNVWPSHRREPKDFFGNRGGGGRYHAGVASGPGARHIYSWFLLWNQRRTGSGQYSNNN